jgi:hypothetical protein
LTVLTVSTVLMAPMVLTASTERLAPMVLTASTERPAPMVLTASTERLALKESKVSPELSASAALSECQLTMCTPPRRLTVPY